jgi:ubiquinone/menaquinone biosynthesis C-methylase UbiE
MPDEVGLTPTDRLVALLDHLGIGVAHVATQIPADIAGLVTRHARRIGAITLCVPTRLDPMPFAGAASRLLMISGERGMTADVTARATDRLPGAKRVVLPGYDAPGWADVVADRTDEILRAMSGFLGSVQAEKPRVAAGEGTHAGITYRIEGSGPALVLLPFFLAPSQWAPAIPQLAKHFTVITLGGRHLGGVAALEDRARAPTYQAMFRTLIDLIAPQPGESILDVGCGAGSLDRALARRLGGANPIAAMDLNRFLLGEAAALAKAEGVDGAIQFSHGSAEALPFPDASKDCIFSITVLEECDADLALHEMVRVAKPGGRIGVIVRSIDLPQWWNMTLPDAIRRKVEVPPQSVGPTGVADASLYARMRKVGLADLVCFPFTVTLDRPGGPIWRYREDHVLSLLTPGELPVWQAARATVENAGLLLTAHAMHCAVGTKR